MWDHLILDCRWRQTTTEQQNTHNRPHGQKQQHTPLTQPAHSAHTAGSTQTTGAAGDSAHTGGSTQTTGVVANTLHVRVFDRHTQQTTRAKTAAHTAHTAGTQRSHSGQHTDNGSRGRQRSHREQHTDNGRSSQYFARACLRSTHTADHTGKNSSTHRSHSRHTALTQRAAHRQRAQRAECIYCCLVVRVGHHGETSVGGD